VLRLAARRQLGQVHHGLCQRSGAGSLLTTNVLKSVESICSSSIPFSGRIERVILPPRVLTTCRFRPMSLENADNKVDVRPLADRLMGTTCRDNGHTCCSRCSSVRFATKHVYCSLIIGVNTLPEIRRRRR
jgi:hypothetical protein